MKHLFYILILTTAFTSYTYSQEMTSIGDKIQYNSMSISVGDAADIAMTKSSGAYMHFKKAKRMTGWNYVWAAVGGYEIGGGAVNLAYGYPIGALDMAIGGGLLGMVISRQKKIKNHITMGVKEFNKSL
jgi:hypothetical protein